MKKEKFEKALKNIIELLERELNPKKIILFGSRAKGKGSSYSDIDLAIACSKKNFL